MSEKFFNLGLGPHISQRARLVSKEAKPAHGAPFPEGGTTAWGGQDSDSGVPLSLSSFHPGSSGGQASTISFILIRFE